MDDAGHRIGSITGGWSITFFTTTAMCATGPPAPPTLALSFAAPSVRLGGSIALSFTITNPNPSTALTGVGFAGTLPAGLVIATPNGASATTCIPPGTITATAGTSLISMAGVTLPPGTSCGFSINITANLAGLRSTGVTPGSANGGSGSPATAALAVVAPPDIAKAFGAATVPTGGTTGLTITLTNPAANTVALTGVGFTDPLPAGLVVATPNALVNTCGGTATAVAGSSSVKLTGGTVPIASSCSVAINVTAATNGILTNVTGTVTSTEGGAGATATANLSVGQAALVDVPALGTWGLLLLAAALAVASGVLLARRG